MLDSGCAVTEEGAAWGDWVGDSTYPARSVSTGPQGRVTGRGALGEGLTGGVWIEQA